MAKFCTKCGAPLVDGQPCQYCQGEEDNDNNTYVEYGKNVFQMILELIKHPVDGFLESVEDEDSKIGLILMGIEAILNGLFLYILVYKIYSAAYSASSSIMGTSFTSAVSNQMQVPSAGGFLIKGLLVSLILSLIISVLVWGLMRALGKAEINWLQSCQITGMKSLGASLGLIFAILGTIAGLYAFAIIVFLIGTVLGYIYFAADMISYPDTSKNAVVYSMLILVIIMMIVGGFIITEMLISAGTSSMRSLQNIL